MQVLMSQLYFHLLLPLCTVALLLATLLLAIRRLRVLSPSGHR